MASGELTVGAGLAGRHIIPFIAGSSGSSQSLFIKRLAPPAEGLAVTYMTICISLAIICLMGLWCCINQSMTHQSVVHGTVGWPNDPVLVDEIIRAQYVKAAWEWGLAMVIFGCLSGIFGILWRRDANKVREKLQAWRQQTVCLDCGQVFR